MAIELTKQQTEEVVLSLRKYFREELEHEIPEMQAKFLLGFIVKEIYPFAYNEGVKDAERYFREKLEDLSAMCFEEEQTYWRTKKK